MRRKKPNKTGKSKKDKELDKIKKQQQQVSPEEKQMRIDSFIKKSDDLANEAAEDRKKRESYKSQFISEAEQNIELFFSEIIEKHQSKFKKEWFYRVADKFGVDRSVMDVYVKPDFVRKFIIAFVYARFPERVLNTLRSRNRKVSNNGAVKLYHHLSKQASDQLDTVINDIYVTLGETKDILEFKMTYSKRYKIYFQQELF